MSDVDPPLGQEILDVAQRQRVSHVHHHDQTDDLRRAVEISERIAHDPSLPRSEAPRAFGLTEPDRDQTTVSENYILNIAGSRYFVQHPPITSNAELDRRMSTGEVSLAIEIPPNFGRDIAHGRDVKIGMWIDGAMPVRAETIEG